MVARAKPKRMYRTMQGRMVDIEKLRAANESVQAVGNMNVNARGDVLGAGGQVVTPKEQSSRSITNSQRAWSVIAPSKATCQHLNAKAVQKNPVAANTSSHKKVAPAPKKAVAPQPESIKPKRDTVALKKASTRHLTD